MAVKDLSRDLLQTHLRVFSSWEAGRSSTMQGPSQHWPHSQQHREEPQSTGYSPSVGRAVRRRPKERKDEDTGS